jgi:hypothetical protein
VIAQRPAPEGNVRWTVLVFQELSQPERVGAGCKNALRRSLQEPFSRAIHQAQPLIAIEGEHGDVDFLHHFSEQRGGFQRSQPLRSERRAHGVDLVHDVGQRILRPGTAAADRVVAFAHSFQKVCQRA